MAINCQEIADLFHYFHYATKNYSNYAITVTITRVIVIIIAPLT